ncbi:MAG: LysE family translocator [Bacteroidia bacterium]|nr:LysE family translocator [Bacteroidia bacterium]
MNYEILSAFAFATAALAFTPGPDNIYVLTQGVVNGRKYGLATTAGLISGCLVHTTLLAFGVSLIIKESESLFFAIKLLGAIYLLYLAYKVYKEGDVINLNSSALPKRSLWQLFRQGFIMNVLNPKVTIFFLAFFPAFLFSKTMSTVWQFYILGFLFMLVSLIIFSAIAIMAGSISSYLRSHKSVGKWLKWVQILVFVGIAAFLLISDN